MEKIIKMDDIHSGYLIERRDGFRMMCMRVNEKNFTKIFVSRVTYIYSSAYNEDLKHKRYPEYDIVKIYGLVSDTIGYTDALRIPIRDDKIDDRPLLWERKEKLRITMEELCKMLGKDVEIVAE
jgi:hypothetical protein